jgi:hypothetical protein
MLSKRGAANERPQLFDPLTRDRSAHLGRPAPSGAANCFVRIQFSLAVLLINAAIATGAELQEVASFANKQLTGVGVSTRSGRVFVNFPYWSDDHSISVAEIVNGQPKAFPNDALTNPHPR